MDLSVTPIYAGLLGLLMVWLSLRVISARRQARVGVGDGGDVSLTRRMRVQANLAEYAPMGLILILLLELQGAPGWGLHTLGLSFVLARVLHAFGMSREEENFTYRTRSMQVTFGVLICGAVANFALALVPN